MAIFCVETLVTLDFDQKNFYREGSFVNALQKYRFYTIKEAHFENRQLSDKF